MNGFEDAHVGEVIAERTVRVTRDSLVRYAGASGDFNPIHYHDAAAAAAGLPGVLAHGMLTMGLVVQPVVDWLGDPARITDYQVRFTRPVIVDPVEGVDVTVVATLTGLDADSREGRVGLTATAHGATVLGKAQLVVDLSR